MIMLKTAIYLLLLLCTSGICKSQSKAFSDPAQMYNRLLLEKGNSVSRIGNFKVNGTPYLYGGQQMGVLFMHGEKAAYAYLSYNTYDQTMEYVATLNAGQPLLKPTGIVDSFKIIKNKELSFDNDLLFVSAKIVNATDNSFYQKVVGGTKFLLFKKYKSDLGIVSTNYIQSDLRQFDLSYEYFYLNAASNELKKIKPNLGFLKKEFKAETDISAIASNDDFSYEPENTLIKIFQVLNQ